MATAVVAPLDFIPLRSFPSVPSLAPSGSFRPSLRGRYPASSLLRHLLTSPRLSSRRSPQVRCRICPLVPSGSTRCVSYDYRASLFPASSPPASGPLCQFVFLRSRVRYTLLSASPHAYALRFATVAVIGSGWLLSSNKILPMLGTLANALVRAAKCVRHATRHARSQAVSKKARNGTCRSVRP